MDCDTPLINRYQAKRQRLREARLRFLLPAEEQPDAMQSFVEEHLPLLEKTAESLYDAYWPQWRKQRGMQISLQFLPEHDMAEINAQYRSVSGSTDVLTFPMFGEEGLFCLDCSMKPITLGDIILCPPVIRRNAAEHGVDEISELTLVLFHGMLHLLAWDHDTPERQSVMWRAQEHFQSLFLRALSRQD